MPEETFIPEGTVTEKKKKRKKHERLFKCSDADFLQRSHVFRQHFLNNKADFVSFHASYNDPFAANWLAKIEAGEALPTDDNTLAELTIQKNNLDEAVERLIECIIDVEYFAEKAFADDKEVLHEFKFNQVNHPDYYNLQFIINCEVIYRLATEDYNAPLLAANMPPTLTTDLKNCLTETTEQEILHEKFKRTRLQRTRLRIKHYNEIYKMNEDVHNAAQCIYRLNDEVRDLFRLDRFA